MKPSGHLCSVVTGAVCIVGSLICLHGCLAATLDGENDIIKSKRQTVPPEALGAVYYQRFSDIRSNEITRHRERQGPPSSTSSCTKVVKVPQHLRRTMRPAGISNYYQKYTEAYGIPVLGSREVSDRALTRACYVLRFLLADRYDLRLRYYKAYGRVAVVAVGDRLRSLPEYRFLSRDFDIATPGLGATLETPVSFAREENILCRRDDNSRDDILLRTIAEGIYQLAVRDHIPGFETELHRLYKTALATGWWRNTFSRFSPTAYFSEGVQSFFNVNAYSDPPNGMSNRVNTRIKLRSYDAALFQVVNTIFPCANNYLQRCNSRGYEYYQRLRTECPIPIWRHGK